MKKWILKALFALCFCYKIDAQNAPTLPFWVSRDSQHLYQNWNTLLYQNAEVYVDSSGKKTLNDVFSERFTPLKAQYLSRFLGFGTPRHRFWVRFKIKNLHPTDTLNLTFGASHVYLSIFNIKATSVVKTDVNFFETNENIRQKLPYRCTHQFLTLPHDSTTLYVYFGDRANESMAWNMSLCTPVNAQKNDIERTVNFIPKIFINALFFGALFMMASVALLFFIFTRQNAYILYALYLFSFLLTFLRSIEAYLNFPILYNFFPISYGVSEGTWAVAVQISYSYFLIKILDLKSRNPYTYKILRGTIWFSWGYLALDWGLEIFFFQEDYALEPYIAYRLIGALLGVFTLWTLRKDTSRVTRLIVYGSLCLLGGIVISIPFSVMQSQFLYRDHLILLKIGIFFEMLFFAAALAFKNQDIALAHRQKLEENIVLLRQLSNQADLKRQAAEAELKHTRAQMRSHLLFNVVNNAKNQVMQGNPNQAAAQLNDLAVFMRLSLKHSRTPSVSLADELQLLKKYVDMEKRRLSDAFDLDWQIVENPALLTVEVPTLILQPFVENAILHGLLPKNKTENRLLSISVEQEETDILCCISDNGVGRPKGIKANLEKSDSMGLSLIEERIALFNDIHKTNIRFTIQDAPNTAFDGADLLSRKLSGTVVKVRIPIN